MTDINKCGNSTCPLREKCWRWLAPATALWQSWTVFEPKLVKLMPSGKDYWSCDGYYAAPRGGIDEVLT